MSKNLQVAGFYKNQVLDLVQIPTKTLVENITVTQQIQIIKLRNMTNQKRSMMQQERVQKLAQLLGKHFMQNMVNN